jgi:hypothetical protein
MDVNVVVFLWKKNKETKAHTAIPFLQLCSNIEFSVIIYVGIKQNARVVSKLIQSVYNWFSSIKLWELIKKLHVDSPN